MIRNTSIDPQRGVNHFVGSGSLLYDINAYVKVISIWLVIRICIDLQDTQLSTSAFGYLLNWNFAIGNTR